MPQAETKDKLTGLAETTKMWDSGKGYFLNVTGQDLDFYGFGEAKAWPGDKIEVEYTAGTGTFAEKYKITAIKVLEKATTSRQTASTPAKVISQSYKPTSNLTSFSREDGITRAVALKAAIELVKSDVIPGSGIQYNECIATIITTAKKFEKYLQGD